MKVALGQMVALEGPNDFCVGEVSDVRETQFGVGDLWFSLTDGECMTKCLYDYARLATPEDVARYQRSCLLRQAEDLLKRAQPANWSVEKLRKVVEVLGAP